MTKTDIYIRFMQQSRYDCHGIYGFKEMTVKTFMKEHPELEHNLKSLVVCRNCLQLKGTIHFTSGQSFEQKCGCSTEREEKWQIKVTDTYKPTLDFNKAYEMCYCCGLEVLPSGSRWSLFFCQNCNTWVRNFNELVGACIVPIGRHSLMNQAGLGGQEANNKAAIKQFTKQLKGTFNRIDVVYTHKQQVMKQNLDLLAEGKEARVIDILKKSQGMDLEERKTEAYLKLLGMLV